jgi:hypothetical protein
MDEINGGGSLIKRHKRDKNEEFVFGFVGLGNGCAVLALASNFVLN